MILCVFAVTLYLSYMLITTVSVSHVEKEKLLIAFYLFLQTKFLLKAEFVKYGSCVIYG
jgi:hypothetical protein